MAHHRSVGPIRKGSILQTISRVIWDFMFWFVASDVIFRKKYEAYVIGPWDQAIMVVLNPWNCPILPGTISGFVYCM